MPLFPTPELCLTFIVSGPTLKTIKDMFSSDDTAAAAQNVETTSDPGTSQADATNTSTSKRKIFGKRSQDSSTLPPGTGPGTSGRPATESDRANLPMERPNGFGSDAAAGTHQGTGVRAINGDPTTSGGQATYSKAGEFGPNTEGKRR